MAVESDGAGEGQRPIGVFDSGVGGLSVLREIRRELPGENLVYVADSAYAPYGEKSREVIEARAMTIVDFLSRRRSKAVVVACNTVTGTSVDALRARFQLPIVAVEPAVKPAVGLTRSGVIGVMATPHTLSSPRFLRLVDSFAGGVRVLVQPSPGLVEQVEAGELSGPGTRSLVEQYVAPLTSKGADVIVLGCTHYPFLQPLIEAVAGPAVTILDPAVAVARELRRRLTAAGLLSSDGGDGGEQFWTTGDPQEAQRVMGQLWTGPTEVKGLPA